MTERFPLLLLLALWTVFLHGTLISATHNTPQSDTPIDQYDQDETQQKAMQGEDSHYLCPSYSILNQVIPYGRAKVNHVLLGSVSSVDDCVQLCCAEGSSCSYAWIFQNNCYSINCSPQQARLCKPVKVTFPSSYVWMKWDGTQSPPDNAVPPTEPQTIPTRGDRPHNSSYDPNKLASVSRSVLASAHSSSVSEVNTIILSATGVPLSSNVQPHPQSLSTHTDRSSSAPAPSTTPHPTTSIATGNKKLLKYNTITVAVEGNKVVTLPQNSLKVFGSSWPNEQGYHYEWNKVGGPASGELVGIHEKILEMNNLVQGIYSLKLTVYDDIGNYGDTTVNVTVMPEPHVNQPPVVVISPKSNATYKLPIETVILDASGSTDDGGAESLSFKWDLMGGPLQALKEDTENWRQPLLKINKPVEGTYRFKLTVTDAEGLSTIGKANFTVVKEQDYPPVANAGSSVLLHLPNNEVTLSGEASRDDKGIVKYEWSEVEGKPVDIAGVSSPRLSLKNLESGLYLFKLVVTDTAGQTSSATVTVDVQEENNQPPIARTNGNVTVQYPRTKAVLNGSHSYDDYQIISYSWTQIGGPTDIVLDGLYKPVLRVSNLHISGQSPTVYEFMLEVTDYRNLTNATVCSIRYYKDKELLPIVDAGEDVTITLPERTAILNGSKSHDGFGIASYQWTRSENSPAAGRVVAGSDHGPVLMVTDLVNGTYNFSLTVTNTKGRSNTKSVILTVNRDPKEEFIVQVYLDEIIYTFNQSDKENLADQLVLKLGQLHYTVHIQDIRPHDQHVLVDFYVTDEHGEMVNSSAIYSSLIRKGQSFKLGHYHAVSVEEKVCHNPCSNRGYCNPRTRRCICSTFWLEDPFKANFGKKQSNCDWSLLYVILIVMGVVSFLLVTVWLCCCCCIRRRKASKRRKVKYAILDHKENEGSLQMLPKDIHGKSHSMIVTETDTEEEILFETSSKKKGDKQERQSLIPKNNKNTPSSSSSGVKIMHNDLSNSSRNVKNTNL